MVADKFGKQHKDVLESIRDILAAENSAARFFLESSLNRNTGKAEIKIIPDDSDKGGERTCQYHSGKRNGVS